jgi:hypothetical protein
MRSRRVRVSPERACELGEAGGAADVGEDEVAGGVVAVFDGGGADVGEGHAGWAGVVLGDGGVGDEVGLLEGDALVEALLAGVDAGEYGCAGEEFEGAAHGEALVATTEGTDAGGGIEDCDAETSSAGEFDFGELTAEWILMGSGARRVGKVGGDQGRGGRCKELPSCNFGSTRSVGSGYGGWLLIALSQWAEYRIGYVLHCGWYGFGGF